MSIWPLIIALAPLPILAIVAGIFIFARSGEKVRLAPGDVAVPLSAAFGSRKGLGPFAGTHNNLNPLLVVHGDGLEYRVVARTTVPYARIESVDVADGGRSTDIVVSLDDGYRFTGRTRDRAAAAAAVRLLAAKGCALTATAAAFGRDGESRPAG